MAGLGLFFNLTLFSYVNLEKIGVGSKDPLSYGSWNYYHPEDFVPQTTTTSANSTEDVAIRSKMGRMVILHGITS
jgi:hypothetical protein